MAIVTVKNKYQVVIPQSVRDQVGVNIGDLFEAAVEKGKITLTPKSLVDRGVAESIAEFKAGRGRGPFGTQAAFLDSLHREARKVGTKKKHSAK